MFAPKPTRRQLNALIGGTIGGAFATGVLGIGPVDASERKTTSHAKGHHAKSHGLTNKGKAPAITGRASPPRPVIMLDPGHGGKDPGAIGISGTYEKHIAEAAAKELCRQIRAKGQYDVVMTRADDHFIPLEGRVDLAHRHKAQLFISMHADALHDPDVRGASVYTLSNGASDAQTASLAQTENSADRFAGPAFHGMSSEVQDILASLVNEETRRGSAHMAASVVSAFQPRIGLLRHPARHAAFVVLKSADIPSVLVEMGFMSNRHDEAALRQGAYRQQVATAMTTAIDRYFAGQRTNLARSG
ncbi:N-acetylmuramoyl-L-alanine amidase [Asaia lannensis]|uniref:N-acetylmuramoyl-L-alanine amidase n=1 Tax=Asaia lannensis NBRC 102526 TaxID=1307926 RepID=A0ABT1CK27_9PROT|nr:N-acetylmuramoyl-L-alanine amidase [Asaia lannensis]MCO6160379.1 N-acetylmuramoyl-L-alanine amidase [Asaia lannensis NBRC 102526]GBQ97809.1 N-acetylmuramoyl-L-alanine amidase [Asaia lannensis NBRC 102526]